jgi:hypothetical protein
LEQGGCTEKPVAAIPKSIVSHDRIPSEDVTFNELLLTRCNTKGKRIALSGFEGYLPCPYARVKSILTLSKGNVAAFLPLSGDESMQPLPVNVPLRRRDSADL